MLEPLSIAGISILVITATRTLYRLYRQLRDQTPGRMTIKQLIKDNKATEITNEQHDCSICLDNKHNKYIKFQCSHIYHKECIKLWLHEHNTCPICRSIIYE